MIFGAVALLAILDGLLVGFRAAAGKNGRIEKDAYYAAALKSALIHATLQVALLAGLAFVLAQSAPVPGNIWSDFLGAGKMVIWVFGPYAAIAMLGLAVFVVPSPDVRTLATVVVLGPFTMLRPALVVATLMATMAIYRSWQVAVMAIVSAIVLLSFEVRLTRKHPVDPALLLR